MSEMTDQFKPIMLDFIKDLNITFPEYSKKWWVYGEDTTDAGWEDLHKYCLTVYPERFFDIMYMNNELFEESNQANTCFLPNVDFKLLYNCDGVTENTKKCIWEHLQFILFTILNSVKDKSEFGKSMDFFEGIDENELHSKLEQTFSNMTGFMKEMEEKMKKDGDSDENNQQSNEKTDPSGNNTKNSPTPEELREHLKSLFGDKLGSLANDIMDELQKELKDVYGINPEEFEKKYGSSTNDALKDILKEPAKFMGIINKIKNKFEKKFASGEISRNEMFDGMKEVFSKMGGGKNGDKNAMKELFKNMAEMGGMPPGMEGMMPNFGKNTRMDTNKMSQMIKSNDTRERILAKLEKRRMNSKNFVLEQKDENNNLVYRPNDSEKQEKSYWVDAPIDEIVRAIEGDSENEKQNTKTPKKKKNKNKNNKKK